MRRSLKCLRDNPTVKKPHFHRFQDSVFYHTSFIDQSANQTTLETLHSKVIKTSSLPISNHLLNIYVKKYDFEYARKVFDEIPNKDVRSWTILISGFAQMGNSKMGLNLFKCMCDEGLVPNNFTLSSVFKCCSGGSDVRAGMSVHGWMTSSGGELDVVLENSVLDFYVKCGVFEYAVKLFESMNERNTVSWNIMMGGCLMIGDTDKALELFRRMPSKNLASWNTVIDGLMRNGNERLALELLYQMILIGPLFDKVTYSTSLILVSSLLELEIGRQIHSRVLRVGISSNGFVVNSLIDMYSKCGELEKAMKIFNNVTQEFTKTQSSMKLNNEPMVEALAWSSMVSGYVQNGRWNDALATFTNMVREHVQIDKFTLTSIVSACANVGILELGRLIHAHVHKIGHHLDTFLSSSMVDMYAKCGSLNDAQFIFEQCNERNVVLWTSIISGCALNGKGREAIRLFELMTKDGSLPNEITFVGVLTACSHTRLIEEGVKYFKLMKEFYGIKPGVEHYTCMVDLYGRAGRLNDAKTFIHENRISHLSNVWMSFLSSCRLHQNIKMGKWVSEKLLKLEPRDAGHYVLLSNIYAAEHKWEEGAKIRNLMQERGVKKHPGQSWIRIKNQVHDFITNDRSHIQESDIYIYLDDLIRKLKEIGYSADVKMVMQDVEEEQGEVFLGVHSEKLAIAFGIINSSSGTPIRVMKNLRICNDCHNFVKYTSQFLNREIVVRDIHRFHHFKHGQCSCGDYW